MNESEWLTCADNRDMLGFVCAQASRRKQRLFVCACFRRIWQALDRPTFDTALLRRAVEISERLADRAAIQGEVAALVELVIERRGYTHGNLHEDYNAILSLLDEEPSVLVNNSASYSLSMGHRRVESWGRAAQCDLIRDLLGNPFRSPPFIDPSWLTWNSGTVKRLAEDAYEHRDLPAGTLDKHRLALLADALFDAGCPDGELLQNLRGPGPHRAIP